METPRLPKEMPSIKTILLNTSQVQAATKRRLRTRTEGSGCSKCCGKTPPSAEITCWSCFGCLFWCPFCFVLGWLVSAKMCHFASCGRKNVELLTSSELCNPTLLLWLRALQPNTPFRAYGVATQQPNTPFRAFGFYNPTLLLGL